MKLTLTRTVRFSAGHHYHRSDWTPEHNERVFGASRHAHGHNYEVDVTLGGKPDPETGFLVDLAALDAVLAEEIAALDQRDLNQVVEDFRSERRQPSTEALAAWFFGRLESRIPGDAELEAIQVRESDSLAATVRRSR